MKNETCSECLVRRGELLLNASTDDDVLLGLLPDIDDISEATDKQKENVRLQCMYLRTAYYFAIQHMNEITWKECCRLAVEDLQGYGLTYITNEKSIRRWNISFRTNETFSIPFQKEKRHPKLFSFFP